MVYCNPAEKGQIDFFKSKPPEPPHDCSQEGGSKARRFRFSGTSTCWATKSIFWFGVLSMPFEGWWRPDPDSTSGRASNWGVNFAQKCKILVDSFFNIIPLYNFLREIIVWWWSSDIFQPGSNCFSPNLGLPSFPHSQVGLLGLWKHVPMSQLWSFQKLDEGKAYGSSKELQESRTGTERQLVHIELLILLF